REPGVDRPDDEVELLQDLVRVVHLPAIEDVAFGPEEDGETLALPVHHPEDVAPGEGLLRAEAEGHGRGAGMVQDSDVGIPQLPGSTIRRSTWMRRSSAASRTTDFDSPDARTSRTPGMVVKASATAPGFFEVARMSMSWTISFMRRRLPPAASCPTGADFRRCARTTSAIAWAGARRKSDSPSFTSSMLRRIFSSVFSPNPFSLLRRGVCPGLRS